MVNYYLRALKIENEIKLQEDRTGNNNNLKHRFVHLLFVIPNYTKCLQPVFSALKLFYHNPDSWTKPFPITIDIIYNGHLLDKGAPTTVPKNKQVSMKPQISTIMTELPSEKIKVTFTPTNNIEPNLCAGRIPRKTLQTHNPATHNPTRYTVCGLSLKELHQRLRDTRNPTDPNKYCLRGPRLIQDK